MYLPGVGLQEDADIVRVCRGAHDADNLLAVLHDMDHLPCRRDRAVCEQRHQQRHVVHLLQMRPDLVYSPRKLCLNKKKVWVKKYKFHKNVVVRVTDVHPLRGSSLGKIYSVFSCITRYHVCPKIRIWGWLLKILKYTPLFSGTLYLRYWSNKKNSKS